MEGSRDRCEQNQVYTNYLTDPKVFNIVLVKKVFLIERIHMEKYKLLRLFILCNCITLSLQILVMEKEDDSEETNTKRLKEWQELGLDKRGMTIYSLKCIKNTANITIIGDGSCLNNLTFILNPVNFESLDEELYLKSASPKKTLTYLIKVTKSKNKVTIKKLTTNPGRNKVTLTLEIPLTRKKIWNQKIVVQGASLKGYFDVNDDKGPEIEATDSKITINGTSKKNLKLTLTSSAFNLPNDTVYTTPTIFLVENGAVYLDINNSQVYLNIGKKTTLEINAKNNSILTLSGEKIKKKMITYNYDKTSKIFIKSGKKKQYLLPMKRKKIKD